jgi:hypothetical protein
MVPCVVIGERAAETLKVTGLQVKKVSLFQIRQHQSGDKGETDVPH